MPRPPPSPPPSPTPPLFQTKPPPSPPPPPAPAINNQLLRLLRHLWIQIVHQHPQRRFLLPALARNLRPPRRAKRSLRQSHLRLFARHRHVHEFHPPPPILTHATPICIRPRNSSFSGKSETI